MSEVKAPSQLRFALRNGLPVVADREFLPADLEILETPPSPVRLALILLICALVVAGIAWAYFGRIDIVAVAQGKIVPTGRVKVIQPLETAKVGVILVSNGQHVKAGDVLVKLDAGDAEAEDAEAQNAYEAYRAEALRRHAAIAAAHVRRLAPLPEIPWDGDLPERFRAREEKILAGDLGQLAETIADYDAQIQQKQIERDRATATMQAQQRLIDVLQERVDMRSTLAAQGAGSRSNLIDAQEILKYQQTQLAIQKGQRDTTAANIDVISHEREKVYASFIADNAEKLAETQRQEDDWKEKLIKAELKKARMDLTSPIDGTVYGLTVTTIGQVVHSGDELMRIVPAFPVLEIQAYLANQDIGFVQPGEKAVVKVASFPFTRYGVLPARVTRVASDATLEPFEQFNGAAGEKAPKEAMPGSMQQTQNLVYLINLRPDQDHIVIEGANAPLLPGMAVTVEISTGSRRILEYLFSPLVEVASNSLKER